MNDQVDQFWRLFTSLADALARRDRLAIRQIDDAARSLGDFDWEIGSEPDGRDFIAISPGGRPELAEGARFVVSRAPKISGWSFRAALPPKRWDGTLKVGEGGAARTFRTGEWLAVVDGRASTSTPGKLDLCVVSADFEGMRRGEAVRAARIAVISWIGEELFLSRIGNLSVELETTSRRRVSLPVLAEALQP